MKKSRNSLYHSNSFSDVQFGQYIYNDAMVGYNLGREILRKLKISEDTINLVDSDTNEDGHNSDTSGTRRTNINKQAHYDLTMNDSESHSEKNLLIQTDVNRGLGFEKAPKHNKSRFSDPDQEDPDDITNDHEESVDLKLPVTDKSTSFEEFVTNHLPIITSTIEKQSKELTILLESNNRLKTENARLKQDFIFLDYTCKTLQAHSSEWHKFSELDKFCHDLEKKTEKNHSDLEMTSMMLNENFGNKLRYLEQEVKSLQTNLHHFITNPQTTIKGATRKTKKSTFFRFFGGFGSKNVSG